MMGRLKTDGLVVAGLATALAFISRDLTIPLAVLGLMGLFDRLIGQPLFGQKQQIQ